MTICGVLLCAACSTLATETSGIKRTRCQHEAPCQLWPLENAADSETTAPLSTTGSPVKMRALKNDMLALPVKEKRLVRLFEHEKHKLILTKVSYSPFGPQHWILLVELWMILALRIPESTAPCLMDSDNKFSNASTTTNTSGLC